MRGDTTKLRPWSTVPADNMHHGGTGSGNSTSNTTTHAPTQVSVGPSTYRSTVTVQLTSGKTESHEAHVSSPPHHQPSGTSDNDSSGSPRTSRTNNWHIVKGAILAKPQSDSVKSQILRPNHNAASLENNNPPHSTRVVRENNRLQRFQEIKVEQHSPPKAVSAVRPSSSSSEKNPSPSLAQMLESSLNSRSAPEVKVEQHSPPKTVSAVKPTSSSQEESSAPPLAQILVSSLKSSDQPTSTFVSDTSMGSGTAGKTWRRSVTAAIVVGRMRNMDNSHRVTPPLVTSHDNRTSSSEEKTHNLPTVVDTKLDRPNSSSNASSIISVRTSSETLPVESVVADVSISVQTGEGQQVNKEPASHLPDGDKQQPLMQLPSVSDKTTLSSSLGHGNGVKDGHNKSCDKQHMDTTAHLSDNDVSGICTYVLLITLFCSLDRMVIICC